MMILIISIIIVIRAVTTWDANQCAFSSSKILKITLRNHLKITMSSANLSKCGRSFQAPPFFFFTSNFIKSFFLMFLSNVYSKFVHPIPMDDILPFGIDDKIIFICTVFSKVIFLCCNTQILISNHCLILFSNRQDKSIL